jgi:hypothetical protein
LIKAGVDAGNKIAIALVRITHGSNASGGFREHINGIQDQSKSSTGDDYAGGGLAEGDFAAQRVDHCDLRLGTIGDGCGRFSLRWRGGSCAAGAAEQALKISKPSSSA